MPAAQAVTVTSNSGSVFVNTSQTGTMFFHSFSAPGGSSGTVTITPNATTSAGTFTGTITVNGCSSLLPPCNPIAGSPKTITVTYNILGLSSTPGQRTFSATTGINPPAQGITLTASGGPATWTSSVNYSPAGTSWLSLGPSNGVLNSSTPSQTVAFNVNTAGLAAGNYNATATFTSGGLTTSVTVALTVADPAANFIAPYVVPATLGGSAIIRGHGFSLLNTGTLSVQLNATPVTASVVSDSEIHITYPALPAGPYTISVTDGVTTIASRSALKLLATNPPAFAATTIARALPSPAAPSNLIYDSERQALLLIDRTNNRVERYAYDSGSGTWPALQSTSNVGGFGDRSIALSPDGTLLLRTDSDARITRMDPASLAILSNTDASPVLGTGSYIRYIAFTNDGGAMGNASSGVSFFRYDMLTDLVTVPGTTVSMQNRLIVASADGGTLLMPSFEAQTPSSGQNVLTYDASNASITSRPVLTSFGTVASTNRDASRSILISLDPFINNSAIQVYDGSWNVLGKLPNGLNGFVLSPDGAFAYAYYPGVGRVRKFELSGFTEVLPGAAVASPGTSWTEMTISPDGGMLFLAGTANVIVLPAP